jgi:two-component system chemotaxis response regulator CheY
VAHRVLIASNIHFARAKLQSILESQGHEVWLADDASEALQKFLMWSPDFVVLDTNLDYLVALAAIREISPKAPVLVCAGLGQKELITQARKLGATDFLAKPFQPDNVEEAFARLRAA